MTMALPLTGTLSVSDYASLVSLVARYLDRASTDEVIQDVPAFIQMCEARLNRILRVPAMEVTSLATIDIETITLPTDFIAMRSLNVEGSSDYTLRAMAPTDMATEFTGVSGSVLAYAVIGNTLRFAPPPAEDTILKMTYWARIPALGDGNPTNWLLDSHADIYLYGTLLQAEGFVSNDDRLSLWKSAYDEAIAELVSAGNKARWGSGPLVARNVTQVRGARC